MSTFVSTVVTWSFSSTLIFGFVAPSVDDVGTLSQMLYDGRNPRSQSQAALLLLQTQSPESERTIREGLRRVEDPDVFLSLASAIAIYQDRRFEEELLAGLYAKKPPVREGAIQALASLCDDALIERLAKRVEDPERDLEFRQAILQIMGRSGRRKAVGVLVKHLDQSEDSLRSTSARMLENLTGQSWGEDAKRWQAWWDRHKELSEDRWLGIRLAYQMSRSDRLNYDLTRAQGQVVRLHQQVYSHLPPAERIGYVQTVAQDEDAGVRQLAVGWSQELLSTVDGTRQQQLADALVRLSYDNAEDVQRAAVLALGRVAWDRSFERLSRLLSRGAPPIRAAAARALAQLARGSTPEAQSRQKVVVPLLQGALEDPSLEVVVEAAEDLGTLGVPEAGPVLMRLLRHSSEPVRQTAAQALERIADRDLLNTYLELADDPSPAVRFSLVGALTRMVGDGTSLTEEQRTRVLAKLDTLFHKDADPGVRSRAATVLGECAQPTTLSVLWKCLQGNEDPRVQEKAWMALMRIVVRAEKPALLQEWDQTLAKGGQGVRRLQLLGEAVTHWQKKTDVPMLVEPALELLIQAQLDQNKWTGALPLLRDMLSRKRTDGERTRLLGWLLTAARQALADGQTDEVLRIVQDARPLVSKDTPLAAAFEKLGEEAKK